MDAVDKETLRRVEENDAELTHLFIGTDKPLIDSADYPSSGPLGVFDSTEDFDFSLLGDALEDNTHVTSLLIEAHPKSGLTNENVGFYESLKQNSSIHEILLRFGLDGRHQGIISGVGREVLNAYDSSTITRLIIRYTHLTNGGDLFLANTIRSCSNLQCVTFEGSYITDQQLGPIVEAISQHRMVDELRLAGNRIGNAGCETITRLLEDSHSNIRILDLANNVIQNEGVITIANSLTNNNCLLELHLDGNPIDSSLEDVHFTKLVGDMSSIDSLYACNHTLCNHSLSVLSLRENGRQRLLVSLFRLNHTNTSRDAALKILKYMDIDMKPLFKWGIYEENDDEYSLRALPYIIAWFDMARDAVAELGAWDRQGFNVETQKLSSIYQFARSMPLLFAPVSSFKIGGVDDAAVIGKEKDKKDKESVGKYSISVSGDTMVNGDDVLESSEDESSAGASSSDGNVQVIPARSLGPTKLALELTGMNEPTESRIFLGSLQMATYKTYTPPSINDFSKF